MHVLAAFSHFRCVIAAPMATCNLATPLSVPRFRLQARTFSHASAGKSGADSVVRMAQKNPRNYITS